MRKIRKALLILLTVVLALSLCACGEGSYTECIIRLDRNGEMQYEWISLTAVEDPDVDKDGEPETLEEIIDFKYEIFKENIEEDPDVLAKMKRVGIRAIEFRSLVIDGIAYTGMEAELMRARILELGIDFRKLFNPRAERSFGKVTLRITTESMNPEPSEEEPAEPAPASVETPEVEHAPSYRYLVVHMPGRAKTNAGVAEGKTVTIDMLDPAQWEGLDEIVISAPVFEPLYVILPLAVLLAALAVWLLIRRKKRRAADNAAELPTEAESESSVPDDGIAAAPDAILEVEGVPAPAEEPEGKEQR